MCWKKMCKSISGWSRYIQDVSVAQTCSALAEEGINIDMISTSGIRISCIIAKDRVHDGVKALHAKFADKLPR